MIPYWQQLDSFSYSKQSLSEMLKEIVDGSFSKNWTTRRTVLVQARKKGLCQFVGEDNEAHLVAAKDVTIIPQQEMQRGEKH